MSNNDLLPPEILALILSKLPVKSILRFRAVCKTWYSLISSPSFISDYSAQTLNQSTTNRVLLLRRERRSGLCKLSSHDDSFVDSHEYDDLPDPFLRPDVKIVGSCNGLVCLFKHDLDDYTRIDRVGNFLILNPCIGKSVQLPIRSSAIFSNVFNLLGFGFDSDSSDYKVLRVVYREYHDPILNLTPLESAIFDMRKGVWRSLNPPMRPCRVNDLSCSCVCLNGTLHWIGDEDFANCFLLSFDLCSEVFLEMEMPFDVEFNEVDHYNAYTMVMQINGLLSVAVLRDKEVSGVHCSVWSMKEYGMAESWTRLFDIVVPCDLTSSPLWLFWENGEVLVRVRREGNDNDNDTVLVLYNPESKTSMALLSTNERVLKACFYKESLVLL